MCLESLLRRKGQCLVVSPFKFWSMSILLSLIQVCIVTTLVDDLILHIPFPHHLRPTVSEQILMVLVRVAEKEILLGVWQRQSHRYVCCCLGGVCLLLRRRLRYILSMHHHVLFVPKAGRGRVLTVYFEAPKSYHQWLSRSRTFLPHFSLPPCFSFPSPCPLSHFSPPKRQSSGLTGRTHKHTHTHIIEKRCFFLFRQVRPGNFELFFPFCVIVPLTFQELISGSSSSPFLAQLQNHLILRRFLFWGFGCVWRCLFVIFLCFNVSALCWCLAESTPQTCLYCPTIRVDGVAWYDGVSMECKWRMPPA